MPLPSWAPPVGEDWGASCGQVFSSLDQMMRKLLAYGMWDTTCTFMLHPTITGSLLLGTLGDDGNVIQGHQGGAQ